MGVEINKKNSPLPCQRHICVVKVMVENAGRDKAMAREIRSLFLPGTSGMKAGTSPFLHVPENPMAYPDTLPVVCVCVCVCLPTCRHYRHKDKAE